MASAPRRLSLVIPGLFGPAQIKQLPEAWQDLALPALEGLLARAQRSSVAERGLEGTLFALFKVVTAPGDDLPVAAVTRQWEAKDAGEHWWLRADPVHLRADRDRLVMLGNTTLTISREECARLAAELNKHFAGEGWGLEAANARRWYLRLDGDPQIRTEALSDVVGQDILRHMPHGQAERRWRSVMNEAQMLLHGSVVNRDREAQGLLPVNSLWLWGGGRLPQAPRVDWSHVWGNDALTQGLASLAGVSCSTAPSDAMEWLGEQTPGEHLLVLDGLQEKVLFGNIEGWRDFLLSLHDAWFEPLYAALKQRRLAALNIWPADGTMFLVTARDARRWWVRRRSLAAWL